MTSVMDPVRDPVTTPDIRGTASWGVGYALVIVVGAVTGFAFVGRSSLFLDETVSTTLAKAPWHRFTQVVTEREANMVLYHLVLRAWISLGTGETAVRSLSVLTELAALGVVMAVTRRLFDRRTAIVCGLLLAVDPLAVEFAQDARGYAASMLLAAASCLLFVSAVRAPRGRPPRSPWATRATWAAWVVVSALAAYTNFWAALVPLAQVVSLALLPAGAVAWRRVALASGALVAALVPLALLIRATDNAGTNWAAGTAAGRVFSRVRSAVPHPVIDAVALVVVTLGAVAVVAWRRRSTAADLERRWPLAFVWCWLVVPIAAVVLLSFAYKPLLVVRYLVVCLPPVMMLVAYAVTRLSGPAMRAVTAVLVVASCVGLGIWYDHGPGQDWRGATDYVAARGAPGDGVLIFAPYMRVPFEWYLAQHPAAEARLHPVYPDLPWGVDPLRFDTVDTTITQPAVTRAADGFGRIWVVLSSADLYPGQERALVAGLGAAGFVPVGSHAFAGVDVVTYASVHHGT